MFIYIYKLIKKDAINDDMVYIGSTRDIKYRMRKHKARCYNINNNCYNLKVYKYIRDNGGWDEWKYEIVDEVEVALRNDAARYEGEYIIKYDAINKLNDIVAGRTPKEYREQNKEQLSQYNKQYNKQYHEQNREQILQKQKQYYQQNREQILQRQKQYNEQNREQILQRQKQYVKQYYQQNKDAINERRRENRRLAKLNTL